MLIIENCLIGNGNWIYRAYPVSVTCQSYCKLYTEKYLRITNFAMWLQYTVGSMQYDVCLGGNILQIVCLKFKYWTVWSGFFSWPKHTRQMIFRRKLGIALVICCFHGHGGVTKDSGESDCDIQISSHFKLIFLSLFLEVIYIYIWYVM